MLSKKYYHSWMIVYVSTIYTVEYTFLCFWVGKAAKGVLCADYVA